MPVAGFFVVVFYSINVFKEPISHSHIGCLLPFVFHLIRFNLIVHIVIHSICAGVNLYSLFGRR